MLFTTTDELKKRALHVQAQTGESNCEVIQSHTIMGGGTLPNRKFPTIALHVKGKADKLELEFRKKLVIGRIEKDKFILDFRSIQEKDIQELINIINKIKK